MVVLTLHGYKVECQCYRFNEQIYIDLISVIVDDGNQQIKYNNDNRLQTLKCIIMPCHEFKHLPGDSNIVHIDVVKDMIKHRFQEDV